MTIRFRSDHLLVDAETLHSPGVVDVAEGKVVWSGPASEAPGGSFELEQAEGILMPGLVNTHAHTPMVLLRGAGEGLPVDRWLTEVMWPREGRLSSEDVWWGMTQGAAELLTGGITTTHEMYFHSDAVAEASAAAGLRAVVTPPVLVTDDLSRFGSWEEQIEDMAALARKWKEHDLVTMGLGPHSAYALPEEVLRRIVALAVDEGLHIHLHVAEGEHEGQGVMDAHGMTVPAFLEEIGMYQTRVVAAHGVWLTDQDIELMGRYSVGVAHCPASNGKHASGIAPVSQMRAAGIPVGIATDGPSSHDRLDLFEEMRLALRYARLRARDAAALGPTDVLAMATSEAANVLGRTDLGNLRSGSRADMVQVGSDALIPVVDPGDIVTHLVYSGGREHIRRVWVGGELVVDDGEPVLVDVVEARRQVSYRARRLAQA